jgi:glucose-1-phosphate cytidylyltransferase
MKVVIFCGGLGLRVRDFAQDTPKPLIPIGPHPMLWHLMKYYAHYGHRDFILCLGYRGDAIKRFFLEYNEAIANDFTMNSAGGGIELRNQDLQNWRITFVDTGLNASIGERLRRVRAHLAGEDLFLANYSDGLTNLALDEYVDFARRQDKTACFLSVRPTASFHVVSADKLGLVESIQPISEALRINCGFFVLKSAIFDYLEPGDDLVVEGFQRLIPLKQLAAYEYDGFWQCADTFKDKMILDSMYERGDTPWMVWTANADGQT